PMVIMNGDAAEPLQFAGAIEAKKGQTELFTIKMK
ncbi:MAG: PTS glucose transporter subunit IIA, partial [Bacillus amyloliquefaciens]